MIATIMMNEHTRDARSDSIDALIAPDSQRLSFNWHCLWNSRVAFARLVSGEFCAVTRDTAASLRGRCANFFRSGAARRLA
jgi:hypothetical protein